MDSVTVRELRNHGGDVLARVERGEELIVTRDGIQVAELRPLRRASVGASLLIARRALLPDIDAAALKSEIDLVLGAGL